MQRSLVLCKPDAVGRRLVGKILQRFEEKGFWIVGMKQVVCSKASAEQHYAEHAARPFFGDLVKFITSSPLVAFVLEGPDAIELVRLMVGKTKVTEALPGTIRGDFGASTQQNLIHASDSPASAEREIGIWFKPEELCNYRPCDGKWVTEKMA
jgi:nucleoside-diphosphate kinase